MPREKRKNRLEKGSGEFLGFGAFAATPPVETSAEATNPHSVRSQSQHELPQWSPVFTGNDQQLHLIFRRITQKRDGLTKARALGELQQYFGNQQISKKEQVSALSHLLFVYHSKLGYDDFATVRAASIQCLQAAYERLPKAWKAMVLDQQYQGGEVWGSLWCAQTDPSSDVRAAALACCRLVYAVDSESDNRFATGVVTYVTRLLGYERPRHFHEALFSRTTSLSKKTSPQSKPTSMSEIERDQLEERYDRILGTALTGVELWVRKNPDADYHGFFHQDILWKTLSSSRSSFRRKTYALLTTSCQMAKPFVYASEGLPRAVTNVLTIEQEAANIPPLFELLLLYITQFPEGKAWDVLDATLIAKHLGKILRKACYGATASQWGPTMLPLLTTLPDEGLTLQRQLLLSMWSGHGIAVAASDGLHIVTAVAECSSFFLLRGQPIPLETGLGKELADLWIKSLTYYLSREGVSNAAKGADRALLHGLTQSLSQLDACSKNRPDSAIYGIKTWFWSEAVPFAIRQTKGSEVDRRLSLLLRQAIRDKWQSRSREQSLVSPIASELFNSTLQRYQGGSGSLPDVDGYGLMIACLQYCGAETIFAVNDGTTLDQFLGNDLLGWIVVHISSQSISGKTSHRDELVRMDFTLLGLSLLSTIDRVQSLWETIAREIVASQCDLGLVAIGLSALIDVEQDDRHAWAQSLQCYTLQSFVVDVGSTALEHFHAYIKRSVHREEEEEVSYEEDYIAQASKTERFLRVCVGLSTDPSLALVHKTVVDTWIDALSKIPDDHVVSLGGDPTVENTLLTIVIALFEQHSPLVDSRDTADVLLAAWRVGGRSWEENAVAWLARPGLESSRIVHELVSRATQELRDALDLLTHSQDEIEGILSCHIWSELALRTLRFRDKLMSEMSFYRPFLECVGLCDLIRWERVVDTGRTSPAVERMYLCLAYLLGEVDDDQTRLELLTSCSSKTAVRIFVALSDVSEQSLVDPCHREDYRVRYMLALLGHNLLRTNGTAEGWLQEAVAIVDHALNGKSNGALDENNGVVQRSISVLSEILVVMFDRTGFDTDVPLTRDIREGQTFWYFTDPSREGSREEVRIVKIHTDDFPSLYFTVRSDSWGDGNERQTIARRLRLSKNQSVQTRTDKGHREKASSLMTDRLLRHRFASTFNESESPLLVEATAEIVNMVVSQSGLDESAGIGSIRYELFLWLSSLQSKLVIKLHSNDTTEQSTSLVRSLSLALGFGHVSPASPHNFRLLGFNPEGSIAAIVERYDGYSIGRQPFCELDRAVLQWISIAYSNITLDELESKAKLLALRLSSHLLQTTDMDEGGKQSMVTLSNSVLVMRLIQSLLQVGTANVVDSGYESVEQDVILALVRAFTRSWESVPPKDLSARVFHSGAVEPLWAAPFDDLLANILVSRRDTIGNAALAESEPLTQLLFDRSKRWFAFRLLQSAATVGKPVYANDECELGLSTLKNQTYWEEGLEEEEKEELENDLLAVSRWTPRGLTEQLERLPDDMDSDDQLDTVGRLLSWLALLSFIESSAAVDVVNRGSFSSYIEKCKGAATALDLAVGYIDFGNERQSKKVSVATVADLHGEQILTSLASHVLFRTVEVFPSLSKRWWEDDCPRALSTSVYQFVERNIAPDILKGELKRIKNAPDLNEMTVTGSGVSREVTATYMQDECQLSVTLSFPVAFPLRNVEVDSSRTLGVAEKRLKRWALQIRQMLNSQDGTLLDALLLWKQNVDQEFAGVEPCVICYSVLSVKSHDLPNLECKTCNNVFHSSCLYQWFHSSGKSQCVVCQQPWSGSRIR